MNGLRAYPEPPPLFLHPFAQKPVLRAMIHVLAAGFGGPAVAQTGTMASAAPMGSSPVSLGSRAAWISW